VHGLTFKPCTFQLPSVKNAWSGRKNAQPALSGSREKRTVCALSEPDFAFYFSTFPLLSVPN